MSLDLSNLPNHVAITMDGNGRWATSKNLPRTKGHQAGLEVTKKIVKAAADLGIKNLTLYAFSTENWKRAEEEVGFLMNLIHKNLCNELNFYKENHIKLRHIGNFEGLPDQIQQDFSDAMEDTKDFTGLTLNIAVNYGGRDEITRGVKKIIQNKIPSDKITEETIRQNLDLADCPDVDLLIRTGGEYRISNFLLWHAAYSEFIFSDTLWPDYNREEFEKHIEAYQNRHRRFGKEK